MLLFSRIWLFLFDISTVTLLRKWTLHPLKDLGFYGLSGAGEDSRYRQATKLGVCVEFKDPVTEKLQMSGL